MTTSFATAEKFWPLTFGERGVLVPFTTPLLAASRIRGSELKTAEFLVPGLSGGKGVYVLPWKAVPEMFKLTVHDRALHEAISNSPDFGPRQMRLAALRVAQTGLAGSDATGTARASLKREDTLELGARFFLTLRIVERMSKSGETLALAELATQDGQKKARRILTAIAGSLDWSFDTLSNNIDLWAAAVAQVGLAEMPTEAPARRLTMRLPALVESFAEWGKADPSGEGASDSLLASEITRETWRLATEYATEVDKTVKQPEDSLRNWTSTIRGTEQITAKMLWILDGWEQVVKLWDIALTRPRDDQRAALRDVVRHLPVVPRDELPSTSQDIWGTLVNSLRKQIKPVSADGQITIGIDLDAMLRLEKLKGTPL
jgi:hypothetical protein